MWEMITMKWQVQTYLSGVIDRKLSRWLARAKFALVLIALVTLCSSAMAEEPTAEDLVKKGRSLMGNLSHQEALDAYDRSLNIGPEKAISAWRGKGAALKALCRESEAEDAFTKAMEQGYGELPHA